MKNTPNTVPLVYWVSLYAEHPHLLFLIPRTLLWLGILSSRQAWGCWVLRGSMIISQETLYISYPMLAILLSKFTMNGTIIYCCLWVSKIKAHSMYGEHPFLSYRPEHNRPCFLANDLRCQEVYVLKVCFLLSYSAHRVLLGLCCALTLFPL